MVWARISCHWPIIDLRTFFGETDSNLVPPELANCPGKRRGLIGLTIWTESMIEDARSYQASKKFDPLCVLSFQKNVSLAGISFNFLQKGLVRAPRLLSNTYIIIIVLLSCNDQNFKMKSIVVETWMIMFNLPLGWLCPFPQRSRTQSR